LASLTPSKLAENVKRIPASEGKSFYRRPCNEFYQICAVGEKLALHPSAALAARLRFSLARPSRRGGPVKTPSPIRFPSGLPSVRTSNPSFALKFQMLGHYHLHNQRSRRYRTKGPPLAASFILSQASDVAYWHETDSGRCPLIWSPNRGKADVAPTAQFGSD